MRSLRQRRLLVVLTYFCLIGIMSFPALGQLDLRSAWVGGLLVAAFVLLTLGAAAGLAWIALTAAPLLRAAAPGAVRARAAAYPILLGLIPVASLLERWGDRFFLPLAFLFLAALCLPRTWLLWTAPEPARPPARPEPPPTRAIPLGA